MQIRTRLTIQFAIIVAAILILASLAIYFFSANYRQAEYFERLENKAITTAILLIEVQDTGHHLLRTIDRNTVSLYDERIQIINYLNEVIYDNNPASNINLPDNIYNQIRLHNKIQYHDETSGKEILGLLYTDQYNRFIVIASAYDVYGHSKLANLRLVLILVCSISLILTLLAGWFYSGEAMKPISNVVSEVEAIGFSNMDARVDTRNGQDEIAQLAITFNNMLERLDAAFQMQRSFVSNASHELRTPLTAITGQLEVTLLKKRDIEEYERVILSVLDDIKNLNLLTNGLLDLAQASFDVSALKFKEQRIDELLWQAIEEVGKRNQNYRINVALDDFPEDENLLLFVGSDHLLKIAFINLMDNACKYSDGKEVTVGLTVNTEKIELSFKDKGIGIPEDDIPFIFTPFFRSENGRHKKGHGLGLALTEKIVQLHNGHITVHSKLNEGTEFTITFLKED